MCREFVIGWGMVTAPSPSVTLAPTAEEFDMDLLTNLPDRGRITLIAEFTARPEQGDVVAELLAGLAVDVRNEPGNIAFDCYRRSDDPSKFVVYEIYRDKPAFAAHISADYGAVFNAKLRDLIVEPNSVLTFLAPVSVR
jgi:quinol monooxygenase YgiN